MTDETALVPVERVEAAIVTLRGQRVILDADIAGLYGVETGALVRAMKRNADRFPDDFVFRLTKAEHENLRSQIGISSSPGGGWGGRRYLPYAFTEQGVAMLSSVLRSDRAVRVNIAIMRAFVRMRSMVSAHEELARRLDELERRVAEHDEGLRDVFEAIRQLMAPPGGPAKRLGFRPVGTK